MFDVGFSEMLMIAVVALVVIGPERLPRVARTLGHLFGRLQRYVNDVKADINREIELDELRKVKTEFEQAAQAAESDLHAEIGNAQSAIGSIAHGVRDAGNPATAVAPTDASAATVAGSTPVAAVPLEEFAEGTRQADAGPDRTAGGTKI